MEGKVALEEHFLAGPRHKFGIISWVLFVALGIATSRRHAMAALMPRTNRISEACSRPITRH